MTAPQFATQFPLSLGELSLPEITVDTRVTKSSPVAAVKPVPERHWPDDWARLCRYFCRRYKVNESDLRQVDRPTLGSLMVADWFPFLLLASQRRTSLEIDAVARLLDLDEWEALQTARGLELRLKRDTKFAAKFSDHLRGLDKARRDSASTIETEASHRGIADDLIWVRFRYRTVWTDSTGRGSKRVTKQVRCVLYGEEWWFQSKLVRAVDGGPIEVGKRVVVTKAPRLDGSIGQRMGKVSAIGMARQLVQQTEDGAFEKLRQNKKARHLFKELRS